MNCFKKSSLRINGAKLQSQPEYHFDIHLENQKFQIINGTVYSENQKPCAGAAVRITQIDCRDNTSSLLGYTLTDENGYYLFSMKAKTNMKYELAVYAPLL
ncbi:carboxypeptidase-like regulatory domain-containing protein [Lacrimispora sp.]|uniref:carboxypeptidase-like regulatory domain-containing protein n=1 Tax=Lacrimispora sp. TaxID=2719234 RepID=UPI002858FFBB|nr:carboxypeptidase-like regulatory domain-containing protein [Lacrimispora sp.]MDR7811344.1 carboxypeptidase-like regulatory domain-containing protein [Lacrimispora sp.]